MAANIILEALSRLAAFPVILLQQWCAHQRIGRIVALLERPRFWWRWLPHLLLEEPALDHLAVALAREAVRVRLLAPELVLPGRAAKTLFLPSDLSR